MKVSFAVIAFALALGGTAVAQTGAPSGGAGGPPPGAGAPSGKFGQACGADVQRFCPTAQTKKDMHACLKENKAQLSQTCSAFLAEKKEKRQEQKQEQQGAPSQAPGQPPSGQPPH